MADKYDLEILVKTLIDSDIVDRAKRRIEWYLTPRDPSDGDLGYRKNSPIQIYRKKGEQIEQTVFENPKEEEFIVNKIDRNDQEIDNARRQDAEMAFDYLRRGTYHIKDFASDFLE